MDRAAEREVYHDDVRARYRANAPGRALRSADALRVLVDNHSVLSLSLTGCFAPCSVVDDGYDPVTMLW